MWNQTNTTSIQPHHCTISFKPKLWSTYSRLIVAGVNSRWCERLEWRLQALASVSAGYIQCCCFFEQPKCPYCWLCFISGIKEPAQPHLGWFLGFTSALPQFWTVTFPRQSIPHHPPNDNISDTTLHVQPSNFYKLFGGNFCEQPLVLGKLLNTVKWSTFWVSFIRVLTILGWL